MTISDPIADLLTRLRNASLARHRFVEVPKSKMKQSIVELLKEMGYIQGFLVKDDPNGQGMIRVYLKYREGRLPMLQGSKRISSPGCRRYVDHKSIPRVRSGLGRAILSTSKGIMADYKAREHGVGGEVLCYVW